MNVLLWGLALLVFNFAVHVVVWKIRVPRRQPKFLFNLFLSLFLTEVALMEVLAPYSDLLQQFKPDTLLQYVHLGLFHMVLAMMYIVFYGALEVDSPSLVMVLRVAKEGERGLPESEFYASMNDDLLVKPRVENLVRDKQAELENGVYRISAKGRAFVSLFIFYRNLLKANKGG